MVVGDDERTKIKRVLVARFISSDEEMEDANTRRKMFVTRPIFGGVANFETLRNSLILRLLSIHLKDPRISSLTENVGRFLRKMFLRTWHKIAG